MIHHHLQQSNRCLLSHLHLMKSLMMIPHFIPSYVGSLCLALLFFVARLFLLAFVWTIYLYMTLLTTTKTGIVIGIKIIGFLVSIPIFVVVLIAVPHQEFAKLS